MKFFNLIFIVLIVLSSCETFNNNLSPDYASGLKNIKHNLEKEKIDLFDAYIEAKKYLDRLDRSHDMYDGTAVFIEEILTEMNDKATEEFKNANYEATLKYILSLRTLGRETSVGLKDAYQGLLSIADASSDQFTVHDIKDEMVSLRVMDEREVFEFLKGYAEVKSRGVFLYYYDQYIKLYPDIEKKFPELPALKQEMLNLKDLNLEKLMDSVVTIILDKGISMKNGMSFFDKSIGTGFFIDKNGYILTNHHVIADHVDPKYEGYSKVYVSTRDKPDAEIPAKVIGYDKVFDIALLQIPVKNEDALVLGRSADMSIGDKIYTIGNPLGIKYTVTTGIISNMDLDFFQFGKGFMIDAAINPGNSGGPLIDERGQVVGIVFAGIPQYEGINFAIPFHWVRKTIPYLYNKGEVKRCWIGSGIYENLEKVFFYYLLPNGPASKAGIRVGDELISIDGQVVQSVEDAQAKLAWKRYPRLLKMVTRRNNVDTEHIVRLEKRPYLPVKDAFMSDSTSNLVTLVFGISLEYYSKGILSKKYRTKKIYKGSYGAQLDIGEGDPVTIYDLRYMDKEEMVKLTIKYRQKEVGVIDRIITVVSPGGINSIL